MAAVVVQIDQTLTGQLKAVIKAEVVILGRLVPKDQAAAAAEILPREGVVVVRMQFVAAILTDLVLAFFFFFQLLGIAGMTECTCQVSVTGPPGKVPREIIMMVLQDGPLGVSREPTLLLWLLCWIEHGLLCILTLQIVWPKLLLSISSDGARV